MGINYDTGALLAAEANRASFGRFTRVSVMPTLARRMRRGYSCFMGLGGNSRSERRHLHLHRVAFSKLRRHPELKRACLDLVEEWLCRDENEPSRPWLMQWREMLSSWPIDRIADVVLDPEAGQTLRKCSPLSPVLTPQERWRALEEVEGSSGAVRYLGERA